MDATRFYELLNSAQQPLWLGCENHSKLSIVLRMLSLKCDYNMTHGCFDAMAQFIKEKVILKTKFLLIIIGQRH